MPTPDPAATADRPQTVGGRTNGLSFRALDPAEPDRLIDFLTSDLWPFHGSRSPTREQVEKWIADGRFSPPSSRAFWIESSCETIGLVNLEEIDPGAAAGWTPVFDLRIRSAHRGKGHGLATLRWLTDHVFREFPNLRRLEGHTRVDNLAMRRTFRAAGFVQEAHYREAWPDSDGVFHDATAYAILRRDFESATPPPPPPVPSAETPLALVAFEELAERFSERAETKAENACIEQPAMRALIGDVRGADVLDAGCGPGILARYLVDSGARVTAFDVSPKMIALARRRLAEPEGRRIADPAAPHVADPVALHVADLAKPLEFVTDAAFDLVVSSLAIDYVRDWSVPLAEFRRALRPGGRLVMSVQHPLGAYLWYQPPSALGVHVVRATWRGFGGDPVVVPDHYRSIEEILNPILEAGFTLRRIVEARPVPELAEINPEHYEKYTKTPTFLLIDAVVHD